MNPKDVKNEIFFFDNIEAKVTNTMYGYDELSIVINDKPIDVHLYESTLDSTLLGLYPAWGNALIWKNESKLIWELIDKTDGTYNVPIFLCPDDLDFSCTIISAKVTVGKQVVYWEKIGRVSTYNYNFNDEAKSGILCISAWSDEDWQKYGNTLALCKIGDAEWEKWISENWDEEQNRRLHNYTNTYFQNDSNMDWFDFPKLTFLLEDYRKSIELFRKEL
ncbi:hypothetical protein [Wukongibacter baidiensis]